MLSQNQIPLPMAAPLSVLRSTLLFNFCAAASPAWRTKEANFLQTPQTWSLRLGLPGKWLMTKNPKRDSKDSSGRNLNLMTVLGFHMIIFQFSPENEYLSWVLGNKICGICACMFFTCFSLLEACWNHVRDDDVLH